MGRTIEFLVAQEIRIVQGDSKVDLYLFFTIIMTEQSDNLSRLLQDSVLRNDNIECTLLMI